MWGLAFLCFLYSPKCHMTHWADWTQNTQDSITFPDDILVGLVSPLKQWTYYRFFVFLNKCNTEISNCEKSTTTPCPRNLLVIIRNKQKTHFGLLKGILCHISKQIMILWTYHTMNTKLQTQ